MYIEEVASKENCKLQLSTLQVDTGHTADFELSINNDGPTSEKLSKFMAKRPMTVSHLTL